MLLTQSRLARAVFVPFAFGVTACSGAGIADLSKGSNTQIGDPVTDAQPTRASDAASAHERAPLPPRDAQEAANADEPWGAPVLDSAADAPSEQADARADDAGDSGPMRDGSDADAGRAADADSGFWVRGVLIKNGTQDQRLDVAGDHVSNDQELMQWPPNGSPSQLWDFARIGVTSEGYPTYLIVNENSKRCIEVQSGNTSQRWRLTQHDCDGALFHQLWAMIPVNANVFALRNVRTQLCADLEDGTGNAGTPIVQSTCQDWASQRWSLVTK